METTERVTQHEALAIGDSGKYWGVYHGDERLFEFRGDHSKANAKEVAGLLNVAYRRGTRDANTALLETTERVTHTPGPWWVGKMGNGKPVIRCHPPGDRNGVWNDIAVIQFGRSAMHPHKNRDPREVDANARLIAAAPDLLEACEAAYRAADRARCGNWHPTIEDQNAIVQAGEICRAAIALARNTE